MKRIIASKVAILDSNVHTGGGTDVTDVLQKILDLAPQNGGVHLVMDGAALIRGLKVHSNTIIECKNADCGFFMVDNINRPLIANADWRLGKISNRNISFIGGTYNHNCTKQKHDVPASEFPFPTDAKESDVIDFRIQHMIYLMEIYGVENLTIKDVVFKNQRTFTLTLGNFKNVLIENTAIEMANHVWPSNQDGFHFFGPGQYLTMRNVRGCTGDDFINIAPDEMDGESSITDVLIDGVVLDNCCQGIRMLSKSKGTLDRVTVRNVAGTYRTFAFSINPYFRKDSFGSYGDLYFENIDLRQRPETYHYTPLTFFQAGGNIECMTLKNIRFHRPVRNDIVFDIGCPFFYTPKELTMEEAKKYGIESYLKDIRKVKGWMPEKNRPRIGTFILDGITIVSDEKSDGTNYTELRYQIDNFIAKNIQLFRTDEASVSGNLIHMSDEANVKNFIIEDIFAEKVNSVLSGKDDNTIDVLKVSNVTLKNGKQILDIEKANIGAEIVSCAEEV